MADSTERKQEPTPLTEEQVEALAERFTASWEALDDSTEAEEGPHGPGASRAQPPGPGNLKRTMLGLAPTTQAAIPQAAEPPAPTTAGEPYDNDVQTAGSIPRQTTLLGIQAPEPSLVEKLAESMSTGQPPSGAPVAARDTLNTGSPAAGYGAGMLAPPPNRGTEPAVAIVETAPAADVPAESEGAPKLDPVQAVRARIQGESIATVQPAPAPSFASVRADPVALGPRTSPEPEPEQAPPTPTPPSAALSPPLAAAADSQQAPAPPPIMGWGPPAVVAPTPGAYPPVGHTRAEAAPDDGRNAVPAPVVVAVPESAPAADDDVPIEVTAAEPVATPVFPDVEPSVPIEVEFPIQPTAADTGPKATPAAAPRSAGAANGSGPAYAPPSAPPQSAASATETEVRSVVIEDESAITEPAVANAAAARLAQHADTIPPERPRLSDLDIPPDFKPRSGKKLALWVGAVLAVLVGIGVVTAMSGGSEEDPAALAEKDLAPDLKAAVTTAADTKQPEPAQGPEPEPANQPAEDTDTAEAEAANASGDATQREAAKPPGTPALRPKKVAAPAAPKQAAALKPTPTPARKTTKAKKPKAKSKTIVRDAPF